MTAPFDPATPDGRNTSDEEVLAPGGRLESGRRYIVPARQGRAFRVAAGQSFRVINTHGSQVVDFWAFVEGDPHEFLSMEHLRPTLGRLTLRPGDGLVTNRRRPILTLIEDTSPGVHDTLMAACDVYRYRMLGHQGYHDNCTDNLRMGLRAIGLAAAEIPAPLNIWMNTPADGNGEIQWLPPVSRPGDAVVFEAALDAVIAVSSCPQDLLPINGADAVPKEFEVELLG